MAKITKDFYKQMAEKMPKTKTIQVTNSINAEILDVELKNYLSSEEKVEFINALMRRIELDIEEETNLDEIVVLMFIYEAFTDIEFPENIEEKLEQFTWLMETGIIKQVSENFRPGVVEETLAFATEAFEELHKLAKKNKELEVKET